MELLQFALPEIFNLLMSTTSEDQTSETFNRVTLDDNSADSDDVCDCSEIVEVIGIILR